jgi:hypothetical protein
MPITSPLRTVRSNGATRPRRPRPVARRSCSPVSCAIRPWAVACSSSRPNIRLISRTRSSPAASVVAICRPFRRNGDPVRDGEDLVEEVRHEDDAEPPVAQPPNHVEEHRHLGGRRGSPSARRESAPCRTGGPRGRSPRSAARRPNSCQGRAPRRWTGRSLPHPLRLGAHRAPADQPPAARLPAQCQGSPPP